jgi:CheY-like chemotaxis protein
MTRTTQSSILLVDNQKHKRETMAVLLAMEGYQVSTATHGLDALHRLELAAPNLIISDFTPPHVTTLEFLSVVRDQFPSIPVIAVTAADSDCRVPDCAMVDVFYANEQCRVEDLLLTVAQMIGTPVTRPSTHEALPIRARLRFTAEDSSGTPFFLLTCTACRLSFSCNITQTGIEGLEQTPCPFCTPSFGGDNGVLLPFAS